MINFHWKIQNFYLKYFKTVQKQTAYKKTIEGKDLAVEKE